MESDSNSEILLTKKGSYSLVHKTLRKLFHMKSHVLILDFSVFMLPTTHHNPSCSFDCVKKTVYFHRAQSNEKAMTGHTVALKNRDEWVHFSHVQPFPHKKDQSLIIKSNFVLKEIFLLSLTMNSKKENALNIPAVRLNIPTFFLKKKTNNEKYKNYFSL